MKKLGNLTDKWWKLAAVIIVCVAAGPEIIVYAEGLIILETLGAATFVSMYIIGAKLYLNDLGYWISKIGKKFYLPLSSPFLISESPGLMIFSTLKIIAFLGVFLLLTLLSSISVYSILSGRWV